MAARTRASRVRTHVGVHRRTSSRSLSRTEVKVLRDSRVRAAVALGHVSLSDGQAEEGGARKEDGVLQRQHQMRLFWSGGPAAACLDEEEGVAMVNKEASDCFGREGSCWSISFLGRCHRG